MRDQQRIEERLSNIIAAQRETLGSQRNAFVTEMHSMRSEIQESIQQSYPIEQPRTTWRAQSSAYIHTPSLPSQPVQPFDIPGRSSRAPSSPRGLAANDEVSAHRPPSERASFEWNMLKAGMTALAEQEEDYDRQGNATTGGLNARPLPSAIEIYVPVQVLKRYLGNVITWPRCGVHAVAFLECAHVVRAAPPALTSNPALRLRTWRGSQVSQLSVTHHASPRNLWTQLRVAA